MPEPVFEKWTDEQCLLLEPTWKLCQVRRDAHHMAYRFYDKYNTMVNLPTILLGAILSTISLNPDASPSSVNAGLAVFITAMSTINTFFGLAKSQEGHRQSYRTFNMIVREIELNLIRGREEPKRSFIDFLEYINERASKMIEDSPTLNPAARKFLENTRGSNPSPFESIVEDGEANGFGNEWGKEGLLLAVAQHSNTDTPTSKKSQSTSSSSKPINVIVDNEDFTASKNKNNKNNKNKKRVADYDDDDDDANGDENV